MKNEPRTSDALYDADGCQLVDFAIAWEGLGRATTDQVLEILHGTADELNTSAIRDAHTKLRGFNNCIDTMLSEWIDGHDRNQTLYQALGALGLKRVTDMSGDRFEQEYTEPSLNIKASIFVVANDTGMDLPTVENIVISIVDETSGLYAYDTPDNATKECLFELITQLTTKLSNRVASANRKANCCPTCKRSL